MLEVFLGYMTEWRWEEGVILVEWVMEKLECVSEKLRERILLTLLDDCTKRTEWQKKTLSIFVTQLMN